MRDTSANGLEQAPLLVDWRMLMTFSCLCLAGFTAGHPLLGSKTLATSPVWVLDPELRWARALSLAELPALPQ